MKTKAKKPRKCSVCDSTEHRADFHGSKKDRAARVTQGPLVGLAGDDAIRALIMPDYAVYIVLTDQVGSAIAGAVKGTEMAPERGTSMISAFARLAERASTIDRKTMTAARSAWQQLQTAQEAYAKAIEPIKAAVVPQPQKGH